MAKLVITVKDASTGAVIPYVSVDVGGVGLSTGLDGTAIFDEPLGSSKVIKVRMVNYRPWTKSVSVDFERTEVTANMEKAAL